MKATYNAWVGRVAVAQTPKRRTTSPLLPQGALEFLATVAADLTGDRAENAQDGTRRDAKAQACDRTGTQQYQGRQEHQQHWDDARREAVGVKRLRHQSWSSSTKGGKAVAGPQPGRGCASWL